MQPPPTNIADQLFEIAERLRDAERVPAARGEAPTVREPEVLTVREPEARSATRKAVHPPGRVRRRQSVSRKS